MAYEEGMAIFYDAAARSILVRFRQKFTILPGPFIDRQAGVIAGQAYCKSMGWQDLH